VRNSALATALLLAMMLTAHAATDPVAKCQALKIKATGKKTFDKARCHQKAFLKATAVDPTCLSRAETKFTDAIARADAAGTCPGDVVSLEAAVDTAVAAYLAGVTCAGERVGGFCWFLGAEDESCDTVCAGEGLVYDSATATYAGNAGTNAHCEAVVNALGFPGPLDVPDLACGDGYGCIVNSADATLRCATPAPVGSASAPMTRRVCACM